MTLVKISFRNEFEDVPLTSYLLECEKEVVKDIILTINSKKWRASISELKDVKKSIPVLDTCSLLQEKNIVMGGYTGGPLGMREFKFPVIYENPSDVTFNPPDVDVQCVQEGHYVHCSLKD